MNRNMQTVFFMEPYPGSQHNCTQWEFLKFIKRPELIMDFNLWHADGLDLSQGQELKTPPVLATITAENGNK